MLAGLWLPATQRSVLSLLILFRERIQHYLCMVTDSVYVYDDLFLTLK